MGATQTVYIPIQVRQDTSDYGIIEQVFVGNLNAAKERTKELRKEYPRPEYLVKRRNCWITIYYNQNHKN